MVELENIHFLLSSAFASNEMLLVISRLGLRLRCSGSPTCGRWAWARPASPAALTTGGPAPGSPSTRTTCGPPPSTRPGAAWTAATGAWTSSPHSIPEQVDFLEFEIIFLKFHSIFPQGREAWAWPQPGVGRPWAQWAAGGRTGRAGWCGRGPRHPHSGELGRSRHCKCWWIS